MTVLGSRTHASAMRLRSLRETVPPPQPRLDRLYVPEKQERATLADAGASVDRYPDAPSAKRPRRKEGNSAL